MELARGETADRHTQVGRAEQSVRQEQFGPLLLGQGETASETGQQPLLGAPDRDVLGQTTDPAMAPDVSGVGLDRPRHDPQQRGLARAVAAVDEQPLPARTVRVSTESRSATRTPVRVTSAPSAPPARGRAEKERGGGGWGTGSSRSRLNRSRALRTRPETEAWTRPAARSKAILLLSFISLPGATPCAVVVAYASSRAVSSHHSS